MLCMMISSCSWIGVPPKSSEFNTAGYYRIKYIKCSKAVNVRIKFRKVTTEKRRILPNFIQGFIRLESSGSSLAIIMQVCKCLMAIRAGACGKTAEGRIVCLLCHGLAQIHMYTSARRPNRYPDWLGILPFLSIQHAVARSQSVSQYFKATYLDDTKTSSNAQAYMGGTLPIAFYSSEAEV